MTATTTTLQALALRFGQALLPLGNAFGPGCYSALGVELPREIARDPALLASLDAARNAAQALQPDVQALAAAIDANDAVAAARHGRALLSGVQALAQAIRAIGSAVMQAAAVLPEQTRQRLQPVCEQIAPRAFESMLVAQLEALAPSLAATLELLGLLDRSPRPDRRLEVRRSPWQAVPSRLYLGRLAALLFQPGQHLQQVFGWGAADFDGGTLLRRVQALLGRLGVSAAIRTPAGQPPQLEAYLFSAQAETDASPPGLRVEFALPLQFNHRSRLQLSDLWQCGLRLSSQLAAGSAVSLRAPLALQWHPVSSAGSIDLGLDLLADRPADDPLVLLRLPQGASLTARRLAVDLSLAATLGSDGARVTPQVGLRLEGGRLGLTPAEGDSLLQELLPEQPLALDFELGADWNGEQGLRLRGAVDGAVQLPAHLKLATATLDGVRVALGLGSDGALSASASTCLTARLGPVTAVVDGIGLQARLSTPADGGNLGVAELSLALQGPRAVGLSLDAQGVMRGEGLLQHDAEQGSYAGVMQLSLHERITVTGVGLITTRQADGRPGFSLLVLVTAEDFQPLPLGMGFTLQGLGGMLAIHRSFDLDVLRAGLDQGLLKSLLFPRQAVGNAPAILQALGRAFPVQRGSHLLGLMVRLGWGTPTLIRFDLALILEFGARRRLLALGRISALLPAPDNDLIRLNLDAIGTLDLDGGTVAVDARLVDSRLAQRFALTGAGALRAGWGSGPDSAFLLAVGGFNPRFVAPAGLPTLPRVAIALSSGRNPQLLCEAYFAISANTLQFGARAHLQAQALGFTVVGDLGFDVLLSRAPLHFIADFRAQMQLRRKSRNLFKVALQGELQGPRPLRVSGKASFEIFWCDFTVRFDTTLVHGDPPPPPPAIDAGAELRQALGNPRSWRSLAPPQAAHGVSLRPLAVGPALVLDPLGRLAVQQDVVPLNTARELDRFGGAPLAGDRRFALTARIDGLPLAPVQALQAPFAPAQYFAMNDDEQLAGPSFESMDAGLVVGSDELVFDAAQVAASPVQFDSLVFDSLGAPARGLPAQPLAAPQLLAQAETGAAARAPVRQGGRARWRNTAAPWVQVQATRRAVAPVPPGSPTLDPAH